MYAITTSDNFGVSALVFDAYCNYLASGFGDTNLDAIADAALRIKCDPASIRCNPADCHMVAVEALHS